MSISDIQNNYFGYHLISEIIISDIQKNYFGYLKYFILDIRNYPRIYEIIYLFFLWSCLCCLWQRLQCLRGISNFKSKTMNHANVTQILDLISAGEYKSQHALNGTLQPKSYISTR